MARIYAETHFIGKKRHKLVKVNHLDSFGVFVTDVPMQPVHHHLTVDLGPIPCQSNPDQFYLIKTIPVLYEL